MDYVKLSRKILEWEWWSDINTSRLFIYMLLKANWKDGKFQGKEIPRGSFVSSLPKLADETALTIREIRTAISHLKSTGELTVTAYSKFSVFTIKNYTEYQASDMQNDSQSTGERHSNDILTTTIEERKKERNNIPPLSPCEGETKRKPRKPRESRAAYNQFMRNDYNMDELEKSLLGGGENGC